MSKGFEYFFIWLEITLLPEFLLFDYNTKLYKKNNIKIECATNPRREELGEFGVALLQVIEFGYKTPNRRRAENTKRFW